MEQDSYGVERDTIETERKRREREAAIASYRVNLGGMS